MEIIETIRYCCEHPFIISLHVALVLSCISTTDLCPAQGDGSHVTRVLELKQSLHECVQLCPSHVDPPTVGRAHPPSNNRDERGGLVSTPKDQGICQLCQNILYSNSQAIMHILVHVL